ncbi:M1 family aminopeptidase [Alistipes sp.]|uniref:M1 family aminopeptidase n=1 Tax=Alistipes sp. TaxID=1872444 RepID=UPI003AF19132
MKKLLLLVGTLLSGILNAHSADGTATPEVLRYDLRLALDIAARTATVSGSLEIDFKGCDTIGLVLWGRTAIRSVSHEGCPVTYRFDTLAPAPVLFIPDGRSLQLANPRPGSGKNRIDVEYRCDMSGIQGPARAFDDAWIELGFYTAWYPVHPESGQAHTEIDITIDEGYRVDGSGIVTRQKDAWHISQPWASFDNVVLASPQLKNRTLDRDGIRFEVVYTDFPEADAEAVLSRCAEMLAFYKTLYGDPDSGDDRLKFSVSVSGERGGYSRKNFITYMGRRYDKSFERGIAHELAHFWWNKAPTDSWQDWLNEAFAEFSTMWSVRRFRGVEAYRDLAAAYREDTAATCPIWGIDRDSPEAFRALYAKGALILCDLEEQIGEERFFAFMRKVAARKITSTTEFLHCTEQSLGRELRDWFFLRLNN